eukprot:TRINITY_DN2868_c0_g1_i1.p1 TRINITY_DN2868_c0_g1~~TRINITY_DN2868_c0_g1_i1.p1  ORF type:complete len:465 (+),score=112.65 TRINITY_DN2868_c0_g1_i1:80-1474(+)
MSKKLFVGSLPDDITSATVKAIFSNYGTVTEAFVKNQALPGKKFAFVTFATEVEAQAAKDVTDGKVQLPGAEKPLTVSLAKNQGLYGQQAPPPMLQQAAMTATYVTGGPNAATTPPALDGPKKIFIGSLPDIATPPMLQEEFGKFGTISDVFVKATTEPGRKWGFVTFSSHAEAHNAKEATDKNLILPGGTRPCEVSIAKNQGLHGEAPMPAVKADMSVLGPRKLFVGNLPDGVTEESVRAEFGRFGGIVEVFFPKGCEPGRQWAFVTYSTPSEALLAKDSAHAKLIMPGQVNPVEVTMAKNQGKYGQDPMAAPAAGAMLAGGGLMQGLVPGLGLAPGLALGGMMAPQLSWRMYTTPTGLPYYHNHATGVTQWEAPAELMGQGAVSAAAPAAAAVSAAPMLGLSGATGLLGAVGMQTAPGVDTQGMSLAQAVAMTSGQPAAQASQALGFGAAQDFGQQVRASPY